MPIRFAITGAGYIAEIHAQSIQSLADAELVALVGRDTERTSQFAARFEIADVYHDIGSMIHAGGVDAVIVCTPNALHAPQALAALGAGLHVLLEKPMGMNAEESSKIFQMAAQTSSQLMVAHCWRFDEEVLWLKARVDAG